MDGVLVIDKPTATGSTDVVRVVRRVAGMRKVGHTGTLDPDATGVLVVCLGRATRLVRFLQEGRKTYHAEIVLGIETTTQDTSGETVATRSARDVDEERFCAAVAGFVGEISQVPPMVSAVKVDGERLYERARRGEVVERPARDVVVHDLVVERFRPGEQATATLLVTCSSGTYVRTLAHDIGATLGCGGALAELRRLANDPFTIEDAHPLDEVERRGEEGRLAEIVLSMRDAVRHLPSRPVDLDDARRVATGGALEGRDIAGPYAVVHDDGAGERLLAIFREDGGQARPEAVFVQPADLDGSA